VVDLSEEFLEYLRTDGVVLPPCAQDTASKPPLPSVFGIGGNNDEISDYDCVFSDEPVVIEVQEDAVQLHRRENRADFPVLEADLRSAIRQLGGAVFCKTNWSAPLDSTWINAGSLKCQRTGEVYLLLKSSDRTAFDFEHMTAPLCSQRPSGLVVSGTDTSSDSGRRYTGAGYNAEMSIPERPTIVLRRWCNLTPSMEFRLFVRDGKLAGISQRDTTTFYEFLSGDTYMNGEEDEEDEEDADLYDQDHDNEKSRLRALITRWFFASTAAAADGDASARPASRPRPAEAAAAAEAEAAATATQDWLTAALNMTSYSADIYIDRRSRIFLVDINVFGYPSDPLLFDWEDLVPCARASRVPFVTLQSRSEERPSTVVQGHQQGPIDVHSAPDFSRFMQIVREQRGQPDDSSSDD